jgi:hypothetical protein
MEAGSSVATVVRRFGTGYLRTTVIHEDGGGGYLWIRQPGADRATIGRPDPVVREVIGRVHCGPVALTLPEPDPEWEQRGAVAYRVSARSVVAEALITGSGDVTAILRNAIRTLAALHSTAPNSDRLGVRLPTPSGPRRLLAWLQTGKGTRSAARLRAEARSIMGVRRLETAIGWCEELLTGRGVLLHGAPGTGSLVLAGPAGSGCLLTGEDLAVGPAEVDFGWLIGELVEFRETGTHPDIDRLVAVAVEGCPSDVDLALLGQSAAIRYLTHIRDFAAYVGWQDRLRVSLRRLAAVVDTAERAELLAAASPA